MNFFEHQARARAQSRWMLGAFVLAVLIVSLLVGSVLALTVSTASSHNPAYADLRLPDPFMVAAGAALVLLVITLASLFKISQLKAGGGAVARALGGVRVDPATRDPRLRRLRNVVEEIAIASGLPVPEVYVLEQEAGINAFAAGYAPADAAIAVTRGSLEKLNRDELQGVIAHEFSHVLNGDMRLNIRLMGLVFGLLVIYVIGRELLEATPRRGRRGGTLTVLGFGLVAAGAVGLLFGRLIKARISRQREFLADASAVQFTRQTLGLATALKKIAGYDLGSHLSRGRGEEVSHMLFGDGFGLHFLFATHPPVLERIRRLEPGFRPESLRGLAEQINDPGYYVPEGEEELPLSRLRAAAGGAVSPEQVVAQVAHPGADDYRYAEQLHATLPADLIAGVQDAQEAPALLLALLLNAGDEALAAEQLRVIAASLGAPQAARVAYWRQRQGNLHAAQRLPLAALVFPILRTRPAAELRRYIELVAAVGRADGRVCAFEFVLGRMLRVQLADLLAPALAHDSGRRRLAHCEDAVALLLAAMADAGNPEPEAARRAFQEGWNHLYPRLVRRYQGGPGWPQLDSALDQLDELVAPAKQLLVEALVRTLAHNGRVTVGEAELLRVACASLHCPLPAGLGSGG
jgi:Zn-dependent protease with chaperone function